MHSAQRRSLKALDADAVIPPYFEKEELNYPVARAARTGEIRAAPLPRTHPRTRRAWREAVYVDFKPY